MKKNQALPPTLDRILVPLGGTFSKFLTSAPSFLYGIPPRISVLYGEFSSWSLRQLFVISLSASDGLVHIADCLFTHMCHSFPIPSTISQDLLTRIVQEVLVRWYGTFSYPTIQENAKVGIGFLIGEIWKVWYWRTTLCETNFTVIVSSQLCKRWSESITGELVRSGEYFSLLTPPLTFAFVQSTLVYFACNLTDLKKLVGGKS